MPTPLGQILLSQGLLSDSTLKQLLSIQQKTGQRLGDIAVSEGVSNLFTLYQAVAHHYQLPFVNLLTCSINQSLLSTKHLHDYLRLQLLPYKKESGTIHIALCEPHNEAITWITKQYGNHYQLAITSPLDIRRTIEQHFKEQLSNESIHTLWKRSPTASAKTILYPYQRFVVGIVLGIVLTALAIAPAKVMLVILAICHIIYSLTMLFKMGIFKAGISPPDPPDWNKILPEINERDLPVYTILVPMYDEANSLPKMLRNMQNMDYPFAKMDIKLVLESDDQKTLDAAYALKPNYQFDIIQTPPSHPRTKPKACNYALRFAKGEFITIYDADDHPDPHQLKKAVYIFRNQPNNIACLQARLNYYNYNDNCLSRLFSLEYDMLFRVLLYGLQKLNIPIPLGGTSNHIPLKLLRHMGEWDPYNVTEDADLGTRLSTIGYRTIMLESDTMEEAPISYKAWIRQRSRWIKGYMQTWLVHMRHPLRLYHSLGIRGFVGFQFFIGFSSFAFLSAPVVWIISLLWSGYLMGLHTIKPPDWLIAISLLNLTLNLLTHWTFSFYCSRFYKDNQSKMMQAAMIYPFYLILHCIASYKALWQLIVKPHFWEKTSHGISNSIQSLHLHNSFGSK